MNFDELVLRMGWGRYQIMQLVCCMIFWLINSFTVLSPIFISYSMPYKCASQAEKLYFEQNCTEGNKSSTFVSDLGQCFEYNITSFEHNASDICEANFTKIQTQKCGKHEFTSDGTVETSIVAEFNLVCDRSVYKYVLLSVFMVGVWLNGLVFGKASDRFGRKNMLLVMLVGTIVIGVATTFVTSLYLYIFLRTVIGFLCFVCPTAMVLTTETMTPKWRTATTYLAGAAFALGTPLLAAFAYFVRDWRSIQLASSLAHLVCLALWWFMDESPRWLIAKGRESEALFVLEKIARNNGAEEKMRSHIEKFKAHLEAKKNKSSLLGGDEDVEDAVALSSGNQGITDMLRMPHLRKLLLVLSYCWTGVSCTYYGLTLNVESVGGNIYVTFLLMGLLTAPAFPLACLLCNKFGRRIVISVCFLLAGLFCIPMYFVPTDNTVLLIIMFMAGRTCISIPFTSLYLYTLELHPTVIRSTAVNFGSSQARIGAIIAPGIAMLEVAHPTLPNIAFGLIALIAGFLILLLPDTRKSLMCDTMDEGVAFIRDNPGPLQTVVVKCARN